MPVNISRLRSSIVVAAVAVVVIVAGVYWYRRLHLGATVERPKQNLGVNIQQSTEHFSLSKSEGGHTLFTVRAAKATQFKEGGHAELKDVNIVIYGRESNRFDQIYGSDFEYDPQSGDVIAKGEVHIDLEADTGGGAHPDQTPPAELKNPIHLLTTGLVFNQKTGSATTPGRIEFRIPQASGYADGATFDSKANDLKLASNVHLTTSEPNAATIIAQRGVISKTPRTAVLTNARIEQRNSTITAGELTVYLRENNSIDHVLATAGVQSTTHGPTELSVRAPQALLYMNEKTSDVQRANLSGGATFQASGASTMSGQADAVAVTFASHNAPDKIHAQGNVRLLEPPRPGAGGQAQTVELAADILDAWMGRNHKLQRAETSEHAQITLSPVTFAQGGAALNAVKPAAAGAQRGAALNAVKPAAAGAQSGARTVITAAKFYATFAQKNLSALTGYPDAKVVSVQPGQADRVSTSRLIEVAFAPSGGVNSVVQRDNFEYHEHMPDGTERAAWAQTASYSPQSEVLTLSGKPRMVEGGMTTTARSMRLDRHTGDATADGDVKTTYSELKPQPGGAMLASGDPIHVTARSMTAQRSTGIAHYTGDARLWQGANIIEGTTIDFDRNARTVLAKATANSRVTTVLTQQDKQGKQTPVNITSASLTYSDNQRVAHFEGGVVMRSADGTVTANKADVYLKAASTGASQPKAGLLNTASGQLDRIVAEGNVKLHQPNREGQGNKLVYTASEEKFVLTGGPPSIFDAEHGTVTGASLTFYTRNDRVLVEGSDSSRAVTTTRVSK